MSVVEELRIDPEFKEKVPALTDDEYRQLEENILAAGEAYDPIKTWNGVIVDGHNRWKIIQDHPEKNIVYRTKEMNFRDKWEAFDWMYANQLGRRNLTDEQKRYLLGKLYEARKHATSGAPKGNQNAGKKQLVQIAPIESDSRDGTAGIIANEQKTTPASVKRAEKFARGIDAIRETNPAFAADILAGKKSEIPKSFIQQVGSASPEHQPVLIDHLVNGTPLKPERPKKVNEEKPQERPFPKKIRPETKRGQEIIESIRESIRNLEEGIATENTVDVFCQNLQCDVADWIKSLNDALSENRSRINAKVEKCIISSIKSLTSLKEELGNG